MSLNVNNTKTDLTIIGEKQVNQKAQVDSKSISAVTLKESHTNNIPTKNNAVVATDPFNEGRKVLKPFGQSNGKNFYFLYTQERLFDKIAMTAPNKLMVQDDIAKLRTKGYTVIIDNKTTTDDWKNAAYDQKAFGIVSLGHGGAGALVTVAKDGDPEGDYLTHWDIDKKKVSPNLKMVYLQACQAGTEEKGWEKALNTDVIAWEKSVTNLEVLASNAHIASAGIFPGIGSYFSIQSQTHGKALGKLINERF